MTKFHINKHGIPAPCRAKPGKCPLGGEHYNSKIEAEVALTKEFEEEYGLIIGVEGEDSPTVSNFDSESLKISDDSSTVDLESPKPNHEQPSMKTFKPHEERGRLHDSIIEKMKERGDFRGKNNFEIKSIMETPIYEHDGGPNLGRSFGDELFRIGYNMNYVDNGLYRNKEFLNSYDSREIKTRMSKRLTDTFAENPELLMDKEKSIDLISEIQANTVIEYVDQSREIRDGVSMEDVNRIHGPRSPEELLKLQLMEDKIEELTNNSLKWKVIDECDEKIEQYKRLPTLYKVIPRPTSIRLSYYYLKTRRIRNKYQKEINDSHRNPEHPAYELIKERKKYKLSFNRSRKDYMKAIFNSRYVDFDKLKVREGEAGDSSAEIAYKLFKDYHYPEK